MPIVVALTLVPRHRRGGVEVGGGNFGVNVTARVTFPGPTPGPAPVPIIALVPPPPPPRTVLDRRACVRRIRLKDPRGPPLLSLSLVSSSSVVSSA